MAEKSVVNEIANLARVEYDPGAGTGDSSLATPVNANLHFNPNKQYVGGKGTTVYNKKASHPDVEAQYGERRYRERPAENDPKKQQSKIEELERSVNMLTALLAKQVQADTGDEEDTADYGLSDENYRDLLSEAKKADPTLKGNPKREEVERIVFEARNSEGE